MVNSGDPAMAVLNKLAERALAGGAVFKDDLVLNALHNGSVGLCRGKCVARKRNLYALAHLSANAFCARAGIPTTEII